MQRKRISDLSDLQQKGKEIKSERDAGVLDSVEQLWPIYPDRPRKKGRFYNVEVVLQVAVMLPDGTFYPYTTERSVYGARPLSGEAVEAARELNPMFTSARFVGAFHVYDEFIPLPDPGRNKLTFGAIVQISDMSILHSKPYQPQVLPNLIHPMAYIAAQRVKAGHAPIYLHTWEQDVSDVSVCSHVAFQKHVDCVTFLLVTRNTDRGKEILLVEESLHHGRNPRTGGGKYFLPAGHVDPGETFIQGGVRETVEETGYEVAVEEAIGTVCFFQLAKYKPCHVFYKATVIGGALKGPDDETLGAKWVPLEECFDLIYGDDAASWWRNPDEMRYYFDMIKAHYA